MEKVQMAELVEIEIMGRKTLATRDNLKRVKKIKDSYYCPRCERVMFNSFGYYRCFMHGYFVNKA